MQRIKQYFYLWLKFRWLHLMLSFEYRANFIFWSIVSLMWTGFNFFFFHLLVNVTGNIGGWSSTEINVLLAVFTIFDGILWSFFNQNMRSYTQSIFSGELSSLLLKPVDTQFMLMTQANDFDGVFRLLFGLAILGQNLLVLHQPTSALVILPFSLLFVAGLVFVYCLWFTISTLAFWVDKLDNINEIVPSFRRVWQLPRELYSGILSTVLTVLFPIGLVTTLPSEWLIGKGSPLWSLFFLGAAGLMFMISRWFFFVSIKRYSGVAN